MSKNQFDQNRRQPGRPRSEESKRSILQATRSILLKDGYAKLNMDKVASASGSSKATIYRWWSTKGELALDAAGDDIAIGTVPDTGDSREDLRIAVDQLIDTFTRRLAGVVIFAAITTGGTDPVMAQKFREEVVYPWRVSAAEALRRAQERGEVTEGDGVFLLDVIVGTVFQRTLVYKDPATDGLTEKILALLFS